MATLFKYFKPKAGGTKRAASSIAAATTNNKKNAGVTPVQKKTKMSSNSTPSTISPEIRQRIEANKKAALLKLQQKRGISSSASSSKAVAPSFKLTLNGLEPAWYEALKSEENKSYFKGITSYLEKETVRNKVFPPPNDIFAAFNSCPLDQVRVVIIGQDPYHGTGQAHGLCFSVKKGIKTPPSLRNIYKELHNDVGTPLKPPHGCLTKWCEQGVFLLNTTLTVRAHNANSHSKIGWDKFTKQVVRVINTQKEGVVFLLWGKHAQKAAEGVSRSKHHVFISSHPSPLGATKTNKPFIGSRCFSKTNDILMKQGGEAIDWNV